MTTVKRISTFISGLIVFLFGILLLTSGESGFQFIIFILGWSFLITGIKYIIYHFRMSRHMVGGKMILFIGIIYFDFGLVTLGLGDSPLIYVVIYLLGIHAFSGAVDILRALEARQYVGASWKLTMTNGIVNILIAVTAFAMGLIKRSPSYLVVIYSLGLIYSGVMRIVRACRRTAIVYVP